MQTTMSQLLSEFGSIASHTQLRSHSAYLIYFWKCYYEQTTWYDNQDL